jgi:endo-1,4-beta-xylanase
MRTLLKKRGFWLSVIIIVIVIIGGLYFFNKYRRNVITSLPSPPLKELSRQHGIEVGNFAITTLIRKRPYRDILTSQFDFVLADNTPNWYFTDGGLRPSPTTYNYKQMDEVVNFAKQHNMAIQSHHYLWGEEKWLPEWLKNGNYNKDQLYNLMHDHIQTVGSHYKGQIREWTVVNEAFTRGQNLNGLHDWWADNTGGKEYIDKAFIWAHEADPSTKLILNDFHNEGINTISDEMYNYIKGAKERGVPIDGIGMQMHIDGAHPPEKDEVITNMKRFGALGVDVYVTEFDVNMNDVQADIPDRNQIEAQIYYEMTRACIESKVCHSFAILGVTDKETWYEHLGLPDSRPLPFDKNYNPKPAFFSLREAFAKE